MGEHVIGYTAVIDLYCPALAHEQGGACWALLFKHTLMKIKSAALDPRGTRGKLHKRQRAFGVDVNLAYKESSLLFQSRWR